MATISLRTLRDRVAGFKPIDAAIEVLEDNPNVIPNLIRGQLYFGYDGDGLRLSPYKSKYYAKKKNEQNPQAGLGNPDLYVTGQFYEGIDAEIANNTVVTYSNDSKNQKLTEMYGDEILKLGEESISELRTDTLQPGMLKKFYETVRTATR